jgi:hypothetical protein
MSNSKTKMSFKKIKNSTNILHNDTGLVLRSVKDKVVIGRLENESVITLDKICVDLCGKWNLKYDTELLKDDAGEEEANEEEAGEEEAGEEEAGEEEADEEEAGEEEAGEEEAGEEEADEEEADEEEADEEEAGEEEADEEEAGEEEAGEEEEKNDKKDESPKIINKPIQKIQPIITQDLNKIVYISELTSQFSENLFKYFDNLNTTYISKITELENNIITNNNAIEKLTNELNNEKENHIKTSQDLSQLQTKFNNIKNLFS